jgi:cytochrome c-type biogenesis protein CcmH/NrfG
MNLTKQPKNKKPFTQEESTKNPEFEQLKALVDSADGAIETAEDIDDQRQAISAQELKERETHRRGEEEYYKLRSKWSWFIFSFIAFMLLFQLLLTSAIGLKWVEFKDYQTFLHLVAGENFAQIIGMGIIVAKFLFPNHRSRDGQA